MLPGQPIEIIDCGLKKYAEVLALQEGLFNKNVQAKASGSQTSNYLILCQHQPVFTLGKSGKRENILVSDEELNAEFYKTNRGGDVTYHGPGQLVAYPIIDLEKFGIGLAQYIYQLEEAIIISVAHYGLKAERLEGEAGIWLDADNAKARKICAIGVRASRHITMHGLAMNVNTDLTYFDKIIPCGLVDKGVTSLQKELNKEIDFAGYQQIFIESFMKVFGAKEVADLSTKPQY